MLTRVGPVRLWPAPTAVTRRAACVPRVVMRSIRGQGEAAAPRGTRRPAFNAKQSLGQNFLVDTSVSSRIVAAVVDTAADAVRGVAAWQPRGEPVVEIGPGTGSLTDGLLEQFPKMRAVELDQRCVSLLRERLPGLGERLVHGDVLKVRWREMQAACAEEAGVPEAVADPPRICVVGNLPYFIVSQVMLALFEESHYIYSAVLMMQKEVAARVCAATRTKSYGILSVMAQLHSDPQVLFDVPGEAFRPRPDVTSALVRLDFGRNPLLERVDPSHLRSVVRTAFQQRRKTLRNSLRSLLTSSNAAGVLSDTFASKRPEELSPEEFIHLTEEVFGTTTPGPAAEDDRLVWRSRKWRAVDDATTS